MNISDETKSRFLTDSHEKNISVSFPDIGLVVDSKSFECDNMSLQELIMDMNKVEFVGCISSIFQIKLYGISQNLKGQFISVSIDVGTEEPIPLFNGIVDSAPSESNRNYKQITAYDELYTKGQIDVAGWYKSLRFPITMKNFRDSLCGYLGLEQENTTLVTDEMLINKEYAPTSLKAINVLKSICQINGVFGIINRYNKFEYRVLNDLFGYEVPYPSLTLFPPFYPAAYSSDGARKEPEEIPYYRNIEYEEYSVKPVDKVTIRMSDEDSGVVYGYGANNYIIQGNMFAKNRDEDELLHIAELIHNQIKDITFVPFTATNNGLPWLECGKDTVSYAMYDFVASAKQGKDVYITKQFYILNRTLEGIQALKDTYSVKGEEYQSEFITDIQMQIDSVKESAEEVAKEAAMKEAQYHSYGKDETYTKAEIDELLNNLIISVPELPAKPDPNKYYAIWEDE